jgi:toxin ParE1/3/4
MKLYEIVWTAKAIQQVDDIVDYISNESVEAAEGIRDEILNRVFQLKKFPYSGQEEELLKKLKLGHRYLVSGNYKIIYRVWNSVVFINSVFDSRQNPTKLKV